MKTITQTAELAAFLVALSQSYKGATGDDGKLSLVESAAFVKLAPQAITAIKGASEIPAELRDADGSEVDELLKIIAGGLDGALDSKRKRRIAERALIATHALADLAAEIAGNNPPQPEILP